MIIKGTILSLTSTTEDKEHYLPDLFKRYMSVSPHPMLNSRPVLAEHSHMAIDVNPSSITFHGSPLHATC